MFSSITSSSAISNLGTRLNSLRRTITLGNEADDPDNEDCSHVSNVLRAYYTEKGRAFPPWLPPDPKAPLPSPARVVATTQIQPGAAAPPGSAYGRNSGGGLGDLWGDSGPSSSPPAAQTASLRRGRSTPNSAATPPSGMASPPTPPTLHPGGARPLPSQRTVSSQSVGAGPPLERAASAQDRLRARLHGGGRSPSPGTSPGVSPALSPTNSRTGSPYYGGEPPAGRKPVGGRMR